MTEFLKDRHGYIIGQVDNQGGRRILKAAGLSLIQPAIPHRDLSDRLSNLLLLVDTFVDAPRVCPRRLPNACRGMAAQRR